MGRSEDEGGSSGAIFDLGREENDLFEKERLLTMPVDGPASACPKQPRRWVDRINNILLPLNLVFLVVNILALLAVALRPERASRSAAHASSLSPAQEAIRHGPRRFTALGESPWTKAPSDQTDEAWRRLIDNGKWFALDRGMFVKINGNPATGLRIPGDAQGRFFGILQVNHQLHCVDILRRSTFFNIDYYRHRDQFANMSDAKLVTHTSHCLEILRQSIQCHGDTAMLTYNWVHGHDWLQPAWRSLHNCQDWELLNDWRRRHDVSHLVTHLERPAWVLDPNGTAPGSTGAVEAVTPIVGRDLEC